MTTIFRPEAKVSSRKPSQSEVRSMADVGLTMEVLYQLS
jgi:hypothetical protein